MRIRILTFDGADEIDFIGPLEVFRRVANLVAGVDVALVTVEPQLEVVTAHHLRVKADGVLEDTVDLLVVPGGGYVANAAAGVRKQIEGGKLPARIAEIYKRGATVAGVCTGTMALAAGGILKGRVATTHCAALNDLRATGAQIAEARVVDDGDIVTCGGVTASLDLALWIVERFWGADLASNIAEVMEYQRSENVFFSEKAAGWRPS